MARVPRVVQSGEQTVVGNIGGIAESIESLAPGLGQVVDAVEQEEQRRIQIRRKDEFIRLETQMRIEGHALRMDIQKNRGFTNPEQSTSAWAAEFPGLMEKYGLQASSPEVEMSIAASGAGMLVDGDSHLRTKFLTIEKDHGLADLEESTDIAVRMYIEATSDQERENIMRSALDNIDLSAHPGEVQRVGLIKDTVLRMQGGRVSALLTDPTPTSLAMANHLLDNHKTLLAGLLPEQVNALRIDAERAEARMLTRQRQIRAEMELSAGKILATSYNDPDKPPMTHLQIAAIPGVTPQQQNQYNRLMLAKARGENLNFTDHFVRNGVWKDIVEGNIAKESDIWDQIGKGLTPEDAAQLASFWNKENKIFSAEGSIQSFNFILKSNQADVTGKSGPLETATALGQRKMGEFRSAVIRRFERGIEEGKDRHDLLDANHPDYIAPPGFVAQFVPSLEEQMEALRREKTGQRAPTAQETADAEAAAEEEARAASRARAHEDTRGLSRSEARQRARKLDTVMSQFGIPAERREDASELLDFRPDLVERAERLRARQRPGLRIFGGRAATDEQRAEAREAFELQTDMMAAELEQEIFNEMSVQPPPPQTSPDAPEVPEAPPVKPQRMEGESVEDFRARVPK
jgi:hypothetical protein